MQAKPRALSFADTSHVGTSMPPVRDHLYDAHTVSVSSFASASEIFGPRSSLWLVNVSEGAVLQPPTNDAPTVTAAVCTRTSARGFSVLESVGVLLPPQSEAAVKYCGSSPNRGQLLGLCSTFEKVFGMDSTCVFNDTSTDPYTLTLLAKPETGSFRWERATPANLAASFTVLTHTKAPVAGGSSQGYRPLGVVRGHCPSCSSPSLYPAAGGPTACPTMLSGFFPEDVSRPVEFLGPGSAPCQVTLTAQTSVEALQWDPPPQLPDRSYYDLVTLVLAAVLCGTVGGVGAMLCCTSRQRAPHPGKAASVETVLLQYLPAVRSETVVVDRVFQRVRMFKHMPLVGELATHMRWMAAAVVAAANLALQVAVAHVLYTTSSTAGSPVNVYGRSTSCQAETQHQVGSTCWTLQSVSTATVASGAGLGWSTFKVTMIVTSMLLKGMVWCKGTTRGACARYFPPAVFGLMLACLPAAVALAVLGSPWSLQKLPLTYSMQGGLVWMMVVVTSRSAVVFRWQPGKRVDDYQCLTPDAERGVAQEATQAASGASLTSSRHGSYHTLTADAKES